MVEPANIQPAAPAPNDTPPPPSPHWTDRVQTFLQEYASAILRNIIGWILMLAALPIGFALPGPFGFPIFIVGFALVTFPGKRKLTARVLRGRRLNIETRYFAIIAGVLAILIPAIVLWIVAVQYEETIRQLVETYTPKRSVFIVVPLLLIVLTWLVTRLSLKLLNGVLSLLPTFRRKIRPWLRKKGLKLLPPRRRQVKDEPPLPEDEILEIDPQHQHRLREAWTRMRPWLRRAAGVAITCWIFAIMIAPLRENWSIVREQIAAISWWRFAVASLMFASFLLFFRAMAWRRILKAFGYRLPYAPAARIWATSEMARYLPGAIWQVVGRVYLAKPYGVPAAVVTTSQILEVCIFLFANVIIAGSCLLYFGAKIAPQARPWLYTALILVPTLAVLLHPKIFYGIANYMLRKLNRPPITKRLRGGKLIELLMWMILGLVLQSLAVYLITDPVLHLKMAWWWVVAGAYCLAWCTGFLAFWAPGGIGVRELVFVTTMQVILPSSVRQQFSHPTALEGLLVFLGFVLRLWTVAGEVILVGATHAWDYRGAIGDPTAPGRVQREQEPAPTTAVLPPPAHQAGFPVMSTASSPSSSSAAMASPMGASPSAGEPS